jgi:hypothetical protein
LKIVGISAYKQWDRMSNELFLFGQLLTTLGKLYVLLAFLGSLGQFWPTFEHFLTPFWHLLGTFLAPFGHLLGHLLSSFWFASELVEVNTFKQCDRMDNIKFLFWKLFF